MTAMDAKIFSWGVRALYIGPGFNVSAHRTGVSVLCCGLGGQFSVATDPADARKRWIRCRTALIPAGRAHWVRFDSAPIGCLYLDPQSADTKQASARMRRDHGAFTSRHRYERELLEVIDTATAKDLEPDALHAALVTLCGIAAPSQRNDAIESAIASMRAAPGDEHRLDRLAKSVGLSESRFRHLFKTHTGVPFRRFRVWNRLGAGIVAAARGMSLTDAAFRAGFSSAAHFSSAFRAMFGLAPSELVRANLKVVVADSPASSSRFLKARRESMR